MLIVNGNVLDSIPSKLVENQHFGTLLQTIVGNDGPNVRSNTLITCSILQGQVGVQEAQMRKSFKKKLFKPWSKECSCCS